jgi:hypothetical protein
MIFLKLFLKGTIRNIKVQKNLDIIKVSNSIQPNKCIDQKNVMKYLSKCF